jgi:quercetin dioxygenase-like cupin family protein
MRYVGPIGLAAIFAGIGTVAAITVPSELPDPLEAGWNGESVCEKLHEDSDHRILRCTFPPSVGHERHFHGRHFGYAASGGRLRITDAVGTREADVPAGSSSASEGVAWHEVVNIGDSTFVYLLIEPK